MGRSTKDTSNLNFKSDKNRIFCYYGRLKSATEKTNRNPIYLTTKNHFTRLVIKDNHERLFHAKASHTLSYIRRKYWIPKRRREVRSALFKCGVCLKYQEGPFKIPNMSPWPGMKVSRSSPFILDLTIWDAVCQRRKIKESLNLFVYKHDN